MENLRQLEALVDNESITIFTPSITLVEVLACKLTDDQEAAFRGLLQRSNVIPLSVTSRIAERAREIRNHYRINDHKIAVPDAIHIATASIYSATALHTYDGCGKRPKHTDLLKLSTPIIGKYPLTICKPEPPPAAVPEKPIPAHAAQGDLFAELETPNDADASANEEDEDQEIAEAE